MMLPHSYREARTYLDQPYCSTLAGPSVAAVGSGHSSKAGFGDGRRGIAGRVEKLTFLRKRLRDENTKFMFSATCPWHDLFSVWGKSVSTRTENAGSG